MTATKKTITKAKKAKTSGSACDIDGVVLEGNVIIEPKPEPKRDRRNERKQSVQN